jgi:hypothetical protein
MNGKSFILHYDSLQILEELTDEQAGILFKAIAQLGENPDYSLDGLMNAILLPFKNQIKRDKLKYAEVCEKRRVAGLKGGRPKLTKNNQKVIDVTNCNQKVIDVTNCNQLKHDSESESDSESDSVNDLSLLPADAVRIAKKIVAHVLSLNPKQKNVNKPKLDKTLWSWSCDVDKLNRIDGRSWNDIDSVFNWVINDDFWRTNILSGSKLRKQFDTLYIKMNKNSKNDFPFDDIHGKYREVMVDGKLKKQYEDGTVR